MHQDISDLQAFYGRPYGVKVRKLISDRVRGLWPDVRGMTVMGVGYAAPYLAPYLGEAQRVGALMPAEQGARPWPLGAPGRTVLIEEDRLPLPDASVDRLLAVHAIEMSESVRRSLREIWRVLKPEGRVVIVVPNRRSMWARLDSTPFGHGQPYSRSQLRQLLAGGMFAIESCSYALATPPVELGLVWRYADAWESAGTRLWPAFSGVIVLEASKQVAATLPKGRAQLVRGTLAHVGAGHRWRSTRHVVSGRSSAPAQPAAVRRVSRNTA